MRNLRQGLRHFGFGIRVAAAVLLCGLGSASALASDVTRDVVKAIEARDCVAAVKALNAALATGSAEALVLGGSMFEQGLCLKPNIERATRLYLRAKDAGAADAPYRLSALYASPAAGPDKGAAIWWALQAGLPLPAPCVVAPELRADAEGFAKLLGQWPAAQLDACVHVSGVLAAMGTEFVLAVGAGSAESMAVEFRPAAGELEAKTLGLRDAHFGDVPKIVGTTNAAGQYSVNLDSQHSAAGDPTQQLREAAARTVNAQVEAVSRDALKRFPRPAGIDAAWRVNFKVENARVR